MQPKETPPWYDKPHNQSLRPRGPDQLHLFLRQWGKLDGGTCPGIFLGYAINKLLGISQEKLNFSLTVSSNVVHYWELFEM
jgi:hypothetical protein